MIHHVFRLLVCCCVECPSDGGSSSSSNDSSAAFLVAKAAVPDVIIRVSNPDVRNSLVRLYCFVKLNHRLPYSNEIWRGGRLGEWTATIRALEARGPLVKEQREAFDAVPLWRTTTVQPVIRRTATATATATATPAPSRTAAAARPPQAAAAAPSAPRVDEKQPLLTEQPPCYTP